MAQPLAILFAGAPGSGKTIAANYLSARLNLPVLSNDTLRRETHLRTQSQQLDIAAFDKLHEERFKWILDHRLSFIYDASIDRRWPELEPHLAAAGYKWQIISFDLSDKLLQKIWRQIQGLPPRPQEPRWLKDHANFLKLCGSVVDLSITDGDLPKLIVKLDRHFKLD